MTTRRNRPTEYPTGMGEVYKGEEWIATVSYNLIVVQKNVITEGFGDDVQELEGQTDVLYGEIMVSQGESNLILEPILTLQLNDGRRLEFKIEEEVLVSGKFRITPAGKGLMSTAST